MNIVDVSKKLKYICGLIALCLVVSLLSFSLTACTDKTLTLDNYSNYIDISASTVGYVGGDNNFRRYTAHVRIEIKEVYDLQNVEIKYKFIAPDFQKTVTESLGNLKKEYLNKIEFNYNEPYTPPFPPDPEVSIEVLEISGNISDTRTCPIVFVVCIFIFAAVVIISMIVYHTRLSAKIRRVCVGMTLSEVVAIMGEPDITEAAGDITTVIWQRRGVRGGPRNCCTLTLKNNKVISKIEQGLL